MNALLIVIIIVLSMCVAALMVAMVITLRKYKNVTSESANESTNVTMMTLLDYVPDIIFAKDKNKRYTYVNETYLRLFGYTKEQVLGNLDSDLPGLDSQKTRYFTETDNVVLDRQENFFAEEYLELPGQGKFTFETSKTPLIVDDELVGLIGIARDVSPRKAAEKKMIEQQRYLGNIKDSLAAIVTAAPVISGDYEAAAKIIAEEGCKILGVTRVAVWRYIPEEYSLRCFAVYVNGVDNSPLLPDYYLNTHKQYADLLFSEKVIVFGQGVAKNLTTFHDYNSGICALIEAPINIHNSLFGVLSIEQDFNELYDKEREWAVEEHTFASSLADIMALAVMGYQRNKAQEAADESNRMKSEFLSNMSHELRTPLSSIIGFMELAHGNEMSKKSKEYMKKTMASAEWLMEIINDLLDLSKIEAGKAEIEKIPFDINKILLGCQTMFMPQISGKKLNFQLNAEPFTPEKLPLGDPKKLRQVLQNLLSNAIKFTESGMITLSAFIKDISENTLSMHFSVKDSGIGMTEEQVKKIFMPFVQADSSTTRKYGGTGLGLPIARNLVELLGGQLLVESELGVGSTFTFDLTFDTVDRGEYFEIIEGEQILFEQKRPVFKGEVLLCEDSEMTRQMILEHLSRVGLSVDIAENGSIGVNKVLERAASSTPPYDLILMDINMPVLDGKEATELIVSNGVTTPIVAITANVLTESISGYKEAGFSDYLGKPFTSKELWHCLIKYITPIAWREIDEARSAEMEQALRQKLIKYFLRDGRDKVRQIRDALDLKDYKLAHRLAHTLKGNAGQLGAEALQVIAFDIESKLKVNAQLVTDELLSSLENAVNSTIYEMEQEASKPPDTADDKSDINAAELLDTIKNLLEHRDASCLKLIDKLRLIPYTENLIVQIENFDFKLATDSLAEIEQKLRESKKDPDNA